MGSGISVVWGFGLLKRVGKKKKAAISKASTKKRRNMRYSRSKK